MTRARPVRRGGSTVARAGNGSTIPGANADTDGARNGIPAGRPYQYAGGDLLPEPREIAAAVRARLAERDQTEARLLCELLCAGSPCRPGCPCPCHGGQP